MRAAAQQIIRHQTSRTASRPAPIGGWNARDSLADMPNGDAAVLTNFIPNSTSCDVRRGSANWVTGFGANSIDTLAAYNAPTGTGKLFAASNGNIYDVTAQGALGAAVVAGLTNNRWQTVNVSTPGGQFLYMVNGSDKPLLFNGAAWTAIDGASAPAITGVTTTTLIHVCLHKKRLFFIQKDSMSVWFLPVFSVGGVASQLDFSTIFRRGGYMMAMDVWTIDGGYGMDDYAAFVTSEGEVAIFKGIDPATAADWVLVGVYQGGAPLSRRCFMKYGGDLILISRDGMISMSDLLSSTRVNARRDITYKIQKAISDAASLLSNIFGWEASLFPNQGLVILNVPFGVGQQQQYIMNTITGAWANFTGWNANCFCRFGEEMYFGTGLTASNCVVKAMTSNTDNGSTILATAVEAFSYFGNPTQLKVFEMARPVIITNGSLSATIGIAVDFELDTTKLNAPTFMPPSSSSWNTGKWNQAVWSGGNIINKEWQSVSGLGYAGALKMKVGSNGINVSWVSTDYLYQPGGVI